MGTRQLIITNTVLSMMAILVLHLEIRLRLMVNQLELLHHTSGARPALRKHGVRGKHRRVMPIICDDTPHVKSNLCRGLF